MPADQDEVDQLLRGAMKTLDAEMPSGYFDGLPQRTLARLEDGTMQTSTVEGQESDSSFEAQNAVVPVPVKEDREEDSGLHDIRSLAQSTKMRLSQNMAAARAPTHDDDILATSSGAWKAVALPEPAKMVSLPEIAELPSKKEIKAREKAEKKAVAADVPVAFAAESPAAAKVTSVTPIGSRSTAKPNNNKILAIAGLGLAAAAGLTVFVMTRGDKPAAPPKPSVVAITTPEAAPSERAQVAAVPPPPPVVAAPEPKLDEKQEIASDTNAAAAGSAAAAPTTPKSPAAKGIGKAGPKKDAVETVVPPKDAGKKDVGKKKDADKAKPTEPGDPNFDDLLNEAGVDKTKKVVAPKLDKKSLSSGDIKTGMNGVAGAAAACYAGTQGTAAVHLTVTPDGKVKSVNVTGVFASTPVAACVAAAVRGASFPPWDGGPQSFNYSYLLQEK